MLVSLLAAGSIALAGCSDDEPAPAADSSASATTASRSAAPEPPVSPLTGQPLKGGRTPDHPVLAVKVDNSPSSAPQVGLGSADMVVEELVEGGITRLATFFYTRVPDSVGPVRSMRATDIGIVKPLNATLVASGGAAQTIARVEEADIPFFTEGAPGFYRDSGRSAPYNLFVDLAELAGTLQGTELPEPYLPFGENGVTGRAATGLTATFSTASSTTFAYTDGAYVNTDSYAGAGDQFKATTVLVLRVEVGLAGYLDPAGYPVPETKFTGRGAVTLFSGGRMMRGSWVKDGLDAPVGLVDGDGEQLTIPPGPVWIELVPVDGGGLTVTR